MTGKLYVCGTPIGNLEDASIRLLKTLRAVDLIACEDTRHTLKLLNRFRIKNRLVSYHEHSSQSREDYILQQLREGKNVALVTDAGMPAISDPGENLVKKAADEGIAIEVVPGPSAFTAALAISGLESGVFLFAGFLPPKTGKRRETLKQLAGDISTIILYEAPHRLRETLQDIKQVMGPATQIAVARELTKKHQEMRRGTVEEMIAYYEQMPPRGEICLIISLPAKEKPETDMEQVIRETAELIEQGINKKEALKIKAREYNIKKSLLYDYFIQE